jgi:uncharacterized protein (DUF58 family)
VLRRLEGRIAGGYRTAARGTGTDLAGLRPYAEGDDARHIDWNVTARLDEPMLRVFNEDRELTLWLVLDRSASMTVGTPGRGKHEVLTELAVLLSLLFSRGGNQVGALLYDNGVARTVPPGTGRRHVLHIASALDRTGGPAKTNGAGSRRRRFPGRPERPNATTDLAAMLDAVANLAKRRSLVVVISDFIGAGDWERSLLRLGQRHEVVALRVVDQADEELPPIGPVVVEDTETGEQLIIDAADPLLRARLRDAVAEREAALAAGMRRAGTKLHRVDTSEDLVPALVGIVAGSGRP